MCKVQWLWLWVPKAIRDWFASEAKFQVPLLWSLWSESMGGQTFLVSVGAIRLSGNSVLLLLLAWLEWHHFVLVLLKEMTTCGEANISSSFYFWRDQGNEEVKLKLFLMLKSKLINWPNKSLICKKSGKLINYPSTTNSMILIPLFVMNNILNNFISVLVCLTQTCHYLMFIILSYHSQLLHCYIFFLRGRVRMVQRRFSRFGFPCFAIPDFVILSNKTVP